MAPHRVNMLSKKNRLRKTAEIERVFKEGRGAGEDFLSLKSAKNDLESARFAFIVSKKTAPKASSRNKIKRRLREAVKSALPQIKADFDIIIIARKGAEIKDFQEIKQAVGKILKKSNLLKP